MPEWSSVRTLVFAVLLLPLCATAFETQRFTARATDLRTGRPVFQEQYEVQVDHGRWVSGTTRYLSLDGKQIAERRFDFSRDRYVPVFTLEQTSVDYLEGVSRITSGAVEVYNVRDGNRQSAALPRVAGMVVDCGSQPYLIDHLGELDAGTVLQFTLGVAGKGDSYHLRVRKIDETLVDGRRAIRVRIELDSIVRLVLPTIELLIDPESMRLLEYTGISNIMDPATQKAYSVRLSYSYP